MKRFGLIGYPLGHSFSKKYFTEKFEKEGLTDHVYELFPIESIELLPGIIAKTPDLCGLNVTIPYKQSVIPFLDVIKMPEGLSAANCIRIKNGILEGHNTDVIGFYKSFSSLLQPHHQKALVLGNGGATAAVTFALRSLNIAYNIVSRRIHGESTLTYPDLNEGVMEEHTVVINTTPLGTYPGVDQCPDIPYHLITARHYLFDLIYNPSETLFLRKGREQGAITRNGYDMLVIQAEESWKIWTSEGTADTFLRS